MWNYDFADAADGLNCVMRRIRTPAPCRIRFDEIVAAGQPLRLLRVGIVWHLCQDVEQLVFS